MPRHQTRHPPPSLRCPHCGAQARHLFYHSTYRTRDGPRTLWRCRRCGKGLSERRGTAFFNLKTPEAEVARSIDAMLRGDTQTSTAQTRRHRRETLRRWRRRAAPRARAVDEEFVTDLRVTDLELDEQWSFAGAKKAPFADSSERGEAWRHKAMARESRLLLEQFVAPRTPEAAERLVNRSFDRLAVGCLPRVSSDGYDAYTKPLSEQVRAVTVYPLRWALVRKGRPGRPPQPQTIPDPALSYGQVEKTREGKRVTKVEKKLVLGPPSTDLAFVSTSLLERQNGTARSRNRYLVRKTYAFAKTVPYLEVTDAHAADINYFKPLVETTAQGFAMRQVSADRAYLSAPNLQAVRDAQAMPYIPFKSNSTANQKRHSQLWKSMFHYYAYNQERFMQNYHKRSNVESTFHMIKSKFGNTLRSKTRRAQINEALCKVLCHNICCLIQSMFELNLRPKFWQAAA